MKEKYPIFKAGIGQDSHRFLLESSTKPCIIAGVIFENVPGLDADSDGDVVYHSICRAVATITSIDILSTVARDLCLNKGITDSKVYLQEALESLENKKIVHVAITLEAKKPKFFKKIVEMRQKIAEILKIDIGNIGITAHTGDGLSDVGCGDGVRATCIMTTVENF